jgi:membrane-bound ClpP family serine protease
MFHGCDKCNKLGALLLLLLGVVFVLQDLAVWNFWNISWYSAVFILMGVAHLGMGHCPECKDVQSTPVKKK